MIHRYMMRDGRRYVMGVDWHIAQDKTDVKLLESRLDPKPASKVLIHEAASGRICMGFLYEEHKESCLAAACIVAYVVDSAIIVQKLDDDHYWACVVQDRSPVPGHDLIVDKAELTNQVYEWISFFSSFPIFGDMPGAIGTIDDLWLSVNEEFASNLRSKTVRSCTFDRKLDAKDVAKYGLVALLVAGIGFGGWMIWKYMSKPSQSQPTIDFSAIRNEQERQRLLAEQEASLRAKVNAYYASIERERAAIRSSLQSSPLASWMDTMRTLPFSVHGYSPERIECSTTSCTVKWMGGRVFTMDKFDVHGAINFASAEDYGIASTIEVTPMPVTRGAHAWTANTVEQAMVRRWEALDASGMIIEPLIRNPMIGPAMPIKVSGVPSAKLPDVTIGHVSDFTLQAGSDIQLSDLFIMHDLAQVLPLSFNKLDAVFSNGRVSSVIISGKLFFPSAELPEGDLK